LIDVSSSFFVSQKKITSMSSVEPVRHKDETQDKNIFMSSSNSSFILNEIFFE